MAWVRIHDGALSHPKIARLSDYQFRVWVWGLAHCQAHLTDGRISFDSISPQSRRALAGLSNAGLWHIDEISREVTVHDFLDWNDSREQVKARQVAAKKRLDAWRATHRGVLDHSSGNAVRNAVTPADETAFVTRPKPNLTKVQYKEQEEEKSTERFAPSSSSSTARSKRPMFCGQRFVVFDWQVEDLIRLLGSQCLQAFDLHEWFFALDARAVQSGELVPQRDNGNWLRQQTLAEVQQRGFQVLAALDPEAHMWAEIAKAGPSKRGV